MGLEASVECGQPGASGRARAGDDQAVREIQAFFVGAQGASNPFFILEDSVASLQQSEDRGPDVASREFVGSLQHPDQLGQHEIGKKKRPVLAPEEIFGPAGLKGIVFGDKPNQDVRVERDHGFLDFGDRFRLGLYVAADLAAAS